MKQVDRVIVTDMRRMNLEKLASQLKDSGLIPLKKGNKNPISEFIMEVMRGGVFLVQNVTFLAYVDYILNTLEQSKPTLTQEKGKQAEKLKNLIIDHVVSQNTGNKNFDYLKKTQPKQFDSTLIFYPSTESQSSAERILVAYKPLLDELPEDEKETKTQELTVENFLKYQLGNDYADIVSKFSYDQEITIPFTTPIHKQYVQSALNKNLGPPRVSYINLKTNIVKKANEIFCDLECDVEKKDTETLKKEILGHVSATYKLEKDGYYPYSIYVKGKKLENNIRDILEAPKQTNKGYTEKQFVRALINQLDIKDYNPTYHPWKDSEESKGFFYHIQNNHRDIIIAQPSKDYDTSVINDVQRVFDKNYVEKTIVHAGEQIKPRLKHPLYVFPVAEVNKDRKHWVTLVIDPKNQTVHLYDPKPNGWFNLGIGKYDTSHFTNIARNLNPDIFTSQKSDEPEDLTQACILDKTDPKTQERYDEIYQQINEKEGISSKDDNTVKAESVNNSNDFTFESHYCNVQDTLDDTNCGRFVVSIIKQLIENCDDLKKVNIQENKQKVIADHRILWWYHSEYDDAVFKDFYQKPQQTTANEAIQSFNFSELKESEVMTPQKEIASSGDISDFRNKPGKQDIEEKTMYQNEAPILLENSESENNKYSSISESQFEEESYDTALYTSESNAVSDHQSDIKWENRKISPEELLNIEEVDDKGHNNIWIHPRNRKRESNTKKQKLGIDTGIEESLGFLFIDNSTKKPNNNKSYQNEKNGKTAATWIEVKPTTEKFQPPYSYIDEHRKPSLTNSGIGLKNQQPSTSWVKTLTGAGMMFLGVVLVAASVAAFVFSFGTSTALTMAGFCVAGLGLEIAGGMAIKKGYNLARNNNGFFKANEPNKPQVQGAENYAPANTHHLESNKA